MSLRVESRCTVHMFTVGIMHLRCTKFCPTTETNNCKKEFLNNRGKANVEGAQEFLDRAKITFSRCLINLFFTHLV